MTRLVLRKGKGKGKGPQNPASKAKLGHWGSCTCSEGCRNHAHLSVKCGESGESYTIRVPHDSRHDRVGWGDTTRRVKWNHPDDGESVGIVTAEGDSGITIHDGTRRHRVRHGQWRPHSVAMRKAKATALGAKVKEKAAARPPLAAGERWITVHPNGDDEKGVPVKISENKDGTHSIVGGAGGKLNHLVLKDVKDPDSDEAKEQAEERKGKKKEKKKAKEKAIADVKASQTDEENEEQEATLQQLKDQKTMDDLAFVAKVRETLGGVIDDRAEDFARAEKMKGPGPANLLRARHLAKQMKQAKAQLRAAKNALVDHSQAEAGARELIEKALEQDPELSEAARAGAEASIAMDKADNEERAAERQLNKRRRVAGQSKTTDKAAKAVDEAVANIDEKEINEALNSLGGRDDADDETDVSPDVPSEEVERRRLQFTQDALQLAKVAKGEMEVDDLSPKARAELDKSVGKKADDPEAVKVAAQREAARRLRRAEIAAAQVEAYREAEQDPDVGIEGAATRLAWADAPAKMAKDAQEAAKEFGLLDNEIEPMKSAEVAALVDLLATEAKSRESINAYRKAKALAEKGELKKAKDAIAVKTGDVQKKVAQSLEDAVRTELAEGLRAYAHQRAPDYLSAHAAGHYDALAEAALSIGGQRYVDRATVDAIGPRNAAMLMRHALEADGHKPKTVMDAVQGHHVATQEKLTREAMAKAEAIVPGLNAQAVEDAGDIEKALAQLDAHDLDIADAQKAVGAAIGRMEGLATLGASMKGKLPSTLEIGGSKGASLESSLAWLHASGLRKGDYDVNYNDKIVSIPQSSWAKLHRKEDKGAVKVREAVRDIKNGKQDEDGWLAPGIVSRTKSSFTDPLPTRNSFREEATYDRLHPGASVQDSHRYAVDSERRKVVGLRRTIREGDATAISKLERQRDELSAAGEPAEAARVGQRIENAKSAAKRAEAALPEAEQLHDLKRDQYAKHVADNGKVEGDTVESRMRDHVGSRLADGESPEDIASDLMGPAARAQAGETLGHLYAGALSSIFPMTDEHGKMRRQSDEANAAHFKKMAQDHVTKRYGDDAAPYHGQDLGVEHPKTHEAVFRALSENPRAGAAFKPPGEHTPQDRAAIRAHMVEKLTAAGAAGGTGKLKEAMEALGPEPDKVIKNQGGLFGGGGETKNPDWLDWNKKRDDVVAKHGNGDTPWTAFVKSHGGREEAFQAAIDEARGDFTKAFHGHYGRLHGKALIAGKTLTANSERHALAMGSPDRAKELRDRERKIADSLRQRGSGGKYASGAVKEATTRELQAAAAAREGQGGLFGGTKQGGMFGAQPASGEAATTTGMPESVGHGERLTLGHQAEKQLESLVPKFAESFDPNKPVNLSKITGVKQSGKFVDQQRVVKQFMALSDQEHGARMGGFMPTGSGKSLTSMSAFTSLHAAGKASRATFLTPSKVVEQFGGEMARFTEPGKYKWQTSTGKSHEQRMEMLRDPENHISVMTHEGFRDTIVKMVADHAYDGNTAEAAKALVGADKHGAARIISEARDHHNMPKSGFTYGDEFHKATTRAAEGGSLLAAVLHGWSHPDNTDHFLAGTATPYKNDEHEVASFAGMLDPHRFGNHEEVVRNMGGHLPSSVGSMRADLDHMIYTAGSKPNVQRTDTSNPTIKEGSKHGGGPLQMGEAQQAAVAKIDEAYKGLTTKKGDLVAHAKAISPARFEGVPESEHAGIAKAMAGSSSIHFNRDHAYRRAINMAPPGQNAKLDGMQSVLQHDQKAGKRSIIFSDRVKELSMLHDHLTKQGLKVGLLHGSMSSKETADFMAKANPERGEPEFDTVLLSKAGEAGLNLQPYSVQHNYDVPQTGKSHLQRSGRIHRSGQLNDVEVHDWHTDHAYERAGRRRLRQKFDLGSGFTSSSSLRDENGLVAHYEQALHAQQGAVDHEATLGQGAA